MVDTADELVNSPNTAIAPTGDLKHDESDQSLDVSPDVASIVARLRPSMPRGGWFGWLGPVLMALVALALRLPYLSQPRAVVFDETYYMKDGLSLLLFGYERQTVSGADASILDSSGNPQSLVDLFKPDAAFVVHPPLGKWVIASGEQLFGVTPFGWRISAVVLGVLSVLIAARVMRRITRSNLIGTLAGLLIAIDGLNIVMSRSALLDISLMFFVLVGFACVVLDRDFVRKRLARRIEATGAALTGFGPPLWWRPWLLLAGLSLGLACGVKWSGIYYLAGFGLMAVLWNVGARRVAGVRHAYVAVLARDVAPAFLTIVILALAAYLATWTGWFATAGGWDRHWAVDNAYHVALLPDAVVSLIHYHLEAWSFHVNLHSPHSYAANPWVWPLQGRPTSFFYESPKDVCGSDNCAQEVVALGNPIIWWAGVLALFHQLWRWAARRDWRAGAVLCAFAAGWVPWLFFQERTVFEFYAIVFEPFIVMALALTLGAILGPATASGNRRAYGAIAVGAVVTLAIAATWFFDPIWIGTPIPYSQWQLRMWLPSWI